MTWVFLQDVPRGSVPWSWIVAWLPKGKRHVWLAGEVRPGLWLKLEPNATQLANVFHHGDLVAEAVAMGMIAIEWPVVVDHSRPHFRGFATCVCIAKWHLGVRRPFVQTPSGMLGLAERMGLRILKPSGGF